MTQPGDENRQNWKSTFLILAGNLVEITYEAKIKKIRKSAFLGLFEKF